MIIPVIRGKIGDWRYYTGIMSFQQIKEYVTSSINELYQATCLDDTLQRALTDNYGAIKDYILHEKERFFNAVILALYNGNPQWLEVEFDNEDFSNVGFLQFSGEEIIFPVDGQHRVAGIHAALEVKPELSSETIPVIFIAHSPTDSGKKRTRKLFSTLNRRAKPVGQNEIIALDEDDVCAIITRDLIQTHPLFEGQNIVNIKGKQIPSTNTTAITSLIALYQCVCVMIKSLTKLSTTKFKEYLLYRPDEKTIREFGKHVTTIFDDLLESTDVLREYIGLQPSNRAEKYRNNSGGNILFRPVVITDYIEAALIISERTNNEIRDVFKKMNMCPQQLNEKPWLNFLWDGEKIINRVSHKLITSLLLYMTMNECMKDREKNDLFAGYSKALTIEKAEAEKYLNPYMGS